MLRADLPVGAAHHVRKIWNHVDELRVDPGQVALLARNGIRVGVASEGTWSALGTIFETCKARVRQQRHVIRNGGPLTVELATVDEAQTIFCYDRGGRLAGKTIPAGDRLLQLDYLLRPELSWCVDVNVVLEIRHDRGVVEWEHKDGVIQQVPAYDRYRFADLGVFVTLNPGEFLIIGPTGEKGQSGSLLGNRFFTGGPAGDAYETVVCITPRPRRIPAVRSKPS